MEVVRSDPLQESGVIEKIDYTPARIEQMLLPDGVNAGGMGQQSVGSGMHSEVVLHPEEFSVVIVSEHCRLELTDEASYQKYKDATGKTGVVHYRKVVTNYYNRFSDPPELVRSETEYEGMTFDR